METEDVKLHVEMMLADQWCVSSNILPPKLATLVGRIGVAWLVGEDMLGSSLLGFIPFTPVDMPLQSSVFISPAI